MKLVGGKWVDYGQRTVVQWSTSALFLRETKISKYISLVYTIAIS